MPKAEIKNVHKAKKTLLSPKISRTDTFIMVQLAPSALVGEGLSLDPKGKDR